MHGYSAGSYEIYEMTTILDLTPYAQTAVGIGSFAPSVRRLTLDARCEECIEP
jgi:hypothetical protein